MSPLVIVETLEPADVGTAHGRDRSGTDGRRKSGNPATWAQKRGDSLSPRRTGTGCSSHGRGRMADRNRSEAEIAGGNHFKTRKTESHSSMILSQNDSVIRQSFRSKSPPVPAGNDPGRFQPSGTPNGESPRQMRLGFVSRVQVNWKE
jgi:hypothetical protein